MKSLLTTTLLTGALLFVGWAQQAQAGGYGRGGRGFAPYYANPYYPSDRRIPYFSEHPPVYYSYPVARPYGYSPYAYPPRHVPEVRLEPLMVPNPHVQVEPTSAKAKLDQSTKAMRTVKPLIVLNPFVEQDLAVVSVQ